MLSPYDEKVTWQAQKRVVYTTNKRGLPAYSKHYRQYAVAPSGSGKDSMPKREDEYRIGSRGPRGTPLCPFCGHPEVYPIKAKRLVFFTRITAWSCANEKCSMYRKRFPSPSYGPGRR